MASAVIGALRVNLGIDSAEFQEGLRNAQGALRNAGRQMQSIGRSMSTYITTPLVGFGGFTLKVAGDFEKSMNQVAAVSGATGDEFARLRDLAKELGASTQFSSSEAADAMNFLAMAGMDVNDILGAMPDTLKLAAAAQLDMASSADIVTNILAGYDKDVSELSGAVDVLVKSFTSANTDLRGLAEAMKYAGPVANAAGVQFEEAAASIGLMGNAGIQGSMAGTSLRGAIARMLNPTNGMRAAMQDAGLAFTDASGRLLPLAEIIEELEPHADNAGLFMELFGQRAGPAMAALVSQGSDALRELTGELENSAGTATQVAAVQMEGFNGAMRELTSAFEGLQLAIADSGLIEWATQAVTAMTSWVQSMSQTNPAMLKWGTIIAAAVAGLGPLLIGLGLMVTAMAAISAPILAVVAAIAAVVTGIALLNQGIQAAMPYIQQLAGEVWARIQQGVENAKQAFERFKDRVVTIGAEIIAAFKALPAQMVQIGSDIISGLWNGIKARWDSVKGGIADLGSSLATSIKDRLGIHSPSRVMHEIGVNIMQGLQGGMESLSGSAAGSADGIAGQIENAFSGIVSSIGEAISGSKKWSDVLKDILRQVSQIVFQGMGSSGGLGGLFSGLFKGILGFARGGSIMPGGAGGIDSQLVMFRKSPNEQVDITKPGQRRGGSSFAPVYNIDARGADQAAIVRLERGLAERDRSFGSMVDKRTDMRQARGTRG